MEYVRQEITTITSTNLTDIYNEWNPSVDYYYEPDSALSNNSIVLLGSYYYRCVAGSVIAPCKGFNPELYENLKWVKYGVSNKRGLLDLSSQSKSVFEGGNLTITFPQNKIRTLGIGNYEADSITIQLLASNGTTILKTYTTDTTVNDNVVDYYTYIYEDYNYQVDRAVKVNIDEGVIIGGAFVPSKYVRVTFNKSIEATRTACGFLIGGTSINMGKTLMGITFSFNSFAEKNIDAFGNLTITKRAVQDLIDFETTIDSGRLPEMRREIKRVINDIVMFILDENDVGNYENLLTLGVIQDCSVLLDNHVEAVLSFSIMEAV